MVSVGYMDPGNWGVDIEAGSKFGYRLLWILLLSNIMAILLQTLATRLGVVAGRDLAQACREAYPRATGILLWILSEIAIAACDLAEVIGTVIALKLLLGLPYLWGVVVAGCDTFLLLALQRRGVRIIEFLTLGLIAVIAGSFIFEIVLAKPAWSEVVKGFIPSLDTTSAEQFNASLYVAIGMLGATVMPHNLYLHSALVQTRAFAQTERGKRLACKYNLIDSLLALNGAFFVNAAILILAVTTFYAHGKSVETLQEAYKLLDVWGTVFASGLFAVALLASGQSSTLTGTLAGQIVMEGFVHLRLQPWVRRLLTRLLAIIPALVAIGFAGSFGQTADANLLQLLILSQVILSLQLPFAIVPLVHFTSDKNRMGEFVSRGWLRTSAWLCALVVVGLNAVLIFFQMQHWAGDMIESGRSPMWIYGTLGPVAIALGLFLAWIAVYPLRMRREEAPSLPAPPHLAGVRYERIGVAVELEGADDAVLEQAAAVARAHSAGLFLIHVVEGLGASFYGPATDDQESRRDRLRMLDLASHLRESGLSVEAVLGFGNPAAELLRIVSDQNLDLLVIGTHGHGFFADLALGRTVSPLLHRLTIPVLVIPTRPSSAPTSGSES
jgi:manganese transport protein